MEANISDSIIYDNMGGFKDLGGHQNVDMNFLIDLDEQTKYYPIQLAASRGNPEFIELMLQNKSVDINAIEQKTSVNSFWIASYYGHGEAMSVLAKHGIDVLNRNTVTKSNALHVAVERQFPSIVKLLVESNFPLNETKHGFTALALSTIYKF